MGLTYNTYLEGNSVYGCKNCKAHLANNEDIISKVSIPIPHLPHPILASSSHPYPYPSPIHPSPLLHPTPNSRIPPELPRPTRKGLLLFNAVVNIETGEPNERGMTTGRHIVRDISCRGCKETVRSKMTRRSSPPRGTRRASSSSRRSCFAMLVDFLGPLGNLLFSFFPPLMLVFFSWSRPFWFYWGMARVMG